MGISGLLPYVKKACRDGHISELAGLSVAIDVSCLLHRGIFGCMDQVATGEQTDFYIYFVRKYIHTLLDLNCHVIMVFDGRPLPAKKEINDERRARRVENLSAGHALLSQGREDEASEMFKRATHITREMVEKTIRFFYKYDNVDILVAPYEADAQLAYLAKERLADVIITQDSDLIVFGCDKIFFKWDHATGNCTIYQKENLPQCFPGPFKFNFDKFRRVCILSGCDYLQAGLPGVGLAKAQTFFTKTAQPDPRLMLKKIPYTLKMPKLRVGEDFIEDFIRAEKTFLHQVVFDPRSRTQLHLNKVDYDGDKENYDAAAPAIFEFAGEILPPETALRLAVGNAVAGRSRTDDLFFIKDPIPEWSVFSPLFESCGRRLEQKKRDSGAKESSCGVFRVGHYKSTSAAEVDIKEHQVGEAHSQPVSLEGAASRVTPKRSASLSATASSSQPAGTSASKMIPQKQRPLRNESSIRWTAEEMMRLYASSPCVANTSSLESKSSQGGVCNFENQKASTKDRKRAFIDQNDEPDVTDEGKGQSFHLNGVSPISRDATNGTFVATPTPFRTGYSRNNASQDSTSTPARGGRTSIYFQNRKSVSNPFKKPRVVADLNLSVTTIDSPVNIMTPNLCESTDESMHDMKTARIDSPTTTSLSGSILSALSLTEGNVMETDKDAPQLKSRTVFNVRQYGFRASGLSVRTPALKSLKK